MSSAAQEANDASRRDDLRRSHAVDNTMLDALPRGELREDGLHFTPAGYAILAERILPQVLAVLGR